MYRKPSLELYHGSTTDCVPDDREPPTFEEFHFAIKQTGQASTKEEIYKMYSELVKNWGK